MSERGECECGLVQYEVTQDDQVHVYACHCLSCQTRSGSAFAEHAMLPASAFVCQGATVSFNRKANGLDAEEVFCSSCRTRIYNRNSLLPDMIFLRAGTLSNSQLLTPMAHLWTKRMQRWIAIPEGVPSFEESPTPEEFAATVQRSSQLRSTDQ